MRTKVLLIGEAPSRTSDPTKPFSGRSGDRLRRLLGRELSPTFAPLNLFDSYPGQARKGTKWDPAAARARADQLVPTFDGRHVVFVGRRVSAAFGYPFFPFLTWRYDGRGRKGFWFAILPHPSGIVRWWNNPANCADVAEFLKALASRRAFGTRPPTG